MCAYCVCMWRTEGDVWCLPLLLSTLSLEERSLIEPRTLLFGQTLWLARLRDLHVSTASELGFKAHTPGFLCLCSKHFIDNHLSNPAHLSLTSGDPCVLDTVALMSALFSPPRGGLHYTTLFLLSFIFVFPSRYGTHEIRKITELRFVQHWQWVVFSRI